MNLYIAPHPPIILSEIGRGEEKEASATISGMEKIANDIAQIKPKNIAIITPHGNVFSDALCINTLDTLSGDFSRFGHKKISYTFDNNKKLAEKMCTELIANDISTLALNKQNSNQYNLDTNLDHGVLVPLYFISKKYSDFKLVHISIGYLSKSEMYEAGKIISGLMTEEDIIIASGDLSHKLSDSGSYSFDEMGPIYDKYIVDAIKNKRYIDILDIDNTMLEHAGQCAHKSLELLIGALDSHETSAEVYSYEGPYGVGYLTAKITRGKKTKSSLMSEYILRKSNNINYKINNGDPYVSLATNTIYEYIKNGVVVKPSDDLPKEFFENQSGVFVSIKKEGRLRGCIGTIEPTKQNIAQEIIENAISASTRDPRFNPIEAHELSELAISVDVLFPPEDIKSREELDVKKYGVIVSRGYERGLLLPNLEGVDTVDHQVSIALEKACIDPNEDYTMQRFKVVRHK